MADLANLRISVDSRDVNSASQNLDNLSATAGRTNASVDKLTAANQRMAAAFATSNKPLIDATRYLVSMQNELERVGKSSLQIKALEIRMAAAAAPTAELAQEIRNVGAALIRAERNMGGAGNGMQQVANRTKLASHEVTNLAFQFQDLGVQLAGGANPLVAIAQQGSQVSGIMMQSGMSVRQFGSAILSVIGNASKALLLNPIFLGIAGAVGAVSLALNFMGDDIKKATGQTVTAGDIMLGTFDVIRDGIKNQVSAAFEAMGYDVGDVWDNVVKYTRKAVNIIIGIATLTPRTIIEAFKVMPAAIGDVFFSSVNLAIKAINSIVEKSVAAINAFINLVNPILEKAGLSIGNITAPRIAELQNNYAGAADRAARAFVKVATDTIDRDFIGEFASVIAKAAAKRGAQREAEEAGKKVGKAASEGAKKALKETFPDMAEIMSQVNAEMMRMQETWDKIYSEDAAAMQDELNRKQKERVDAAYAEFEVRQKNNEELRKTVDYLDRTFGLNGGLNSFFDALKSGFGDAFDAIVKNFVGLRDTVSNLLGKLGTSFEKVAAGFQMGGAVASATGGSQLGGGIGGAIGQKIGEKVLGKALGSFAGPLGAIAGGLLGGLIGGLFSKTKTGTATLTQIAGGAMQKTISGNNAALKGIADKMVNGLLTSLNNIAEQLGGSLGGSVKLSIGQRNKDFVVDPTGMGRTKGSGVINFGQDQAAAVAYVTQLAIQQGIITGISAGAQTLIKAGGDLNAQVQKALKFDQVFKDLKKEIDPAAAAIDELNAEMAKLKAIFGEAGASAEDYAKLEELFAIKQAKAIFEANRPRRELEIQLMEAQGKTAEALAAKRALELEGMEAGLRGLQQQVWAAEDAAKANEELAAAQEKAAEEAKAAAEAAKALADSRRTLEIELMEALGDASGALAARRQLELAAMDESLRGLQEQIWAALDAKAAADAAAEASRALAEEQAKQLEAANKLAADRRELEIQLLEAQGRSVEALTARRALELAATDETLRALKEQIWAAQAKAEADAAAAKAAEEAAAAEAKAAKEAADAMQQYMDTLSDVSKTVIDEINRLRGINATSASVLLKAQFATLTAQARTGNLDALAKLPELSRSIEAATASSAGSALEVARIRAWLSASLSETLAAQAASNAQVNTTGAGLIFDGNETGTASTAQTADAISNMRGDLYSALYQIAKNTGKSYELMDRWDGDGLPDIREDASDYY